MGLTLSGVMAGSSRAYGLAYVSGASATPAQVNRFSSGFSTGTPIINTNPAYIGLGEDFSGVAWLPGSGLSTTSSRVINTTMLTPLTFALAHHYSSVFIPGNQINFVNGDGQLLTSSIGSVNSPITIPNYTTDFALGTLTTGFATDQNVTVYRLLDIASQNDTNMPVIVYGSQANNQGPTIGTASVSSSSALYYNWSANSGSPAPTGSAAYWQGGDSGSPMFIPYQAPGSATSQLTFAGTAWYPNAVNIYLPYSGYNPIPYLNSAIEPTGYALLWTIYNNPADPANTAPSWTGGAGNGTFANAANWSSGTVPNSLPVLWNADAAHGQTNIDFGSANVSLRGMLFEASTSTAGFTLSGSGTLSIDYTGIRNESTATQTFDVPITLLDCQNWEAADGNLVFNDTINTGAGTGAAASGYLVVVAGDYNTNINAVISGNGMLAKDGTGTLTLAAANTYTGATIIHNGTLTLAAGGSLPSGAPVTFITGNAAATLNLNGINQTVGEISSQYGATGNILLGGATLTVDSTANGSNAYLGTISESGTLVKTGTGTWTMSGSDTHTGTTMIEGGALRLASAGALSPNANLILNGGVAELSAQDFTESLGTQAGQVQFAGSGGFSAWGAKRTVNLGGIGETLTWGQTAGFLANGQTLMLSSTNANATVQMVNPLNFNGGMQTIQVAGGSAPVDALLSGTLSNGGLITGGTGVLELTGNNTYAGTTQVSGGSLLIGNAASLGGGNLNLSGGVLVLGAGDFTRSLGTGAGQVQLGNGGGFAAYGAPRTVNIGGAGATLTWGTTGFTGSWPDSLVFGSKVDNATVNLENPINLNLGSSAGYRTIDVYHGSAAIDANIFGNISGTGGLTINGNGTLELSGNNTYTGQTAINNATVLLASSGALAPGNLALNHGAVLLLGSGDFTESLGTGAGEIQFIGGAGGGFGAYGATRKVNLGGTGATVTWGSGNFIPSAGTFYLSSTSSNATVNFENSINLNGTAQAYIQTAHGSAPIDAILSGAISNGGLVLQGNGTLELTGNNTYTGTTLVRGGVLLLGSAHALGSGSLILNGGVLMLGAGDLTRSMGTGAGQIALWNGGGFAAYGADRTVNLGGAGATVDWGQNGFLNSGMPLILSSSSANATLNFVNPIQLNRQNVIQVNRGSAAIDANLMGSITGSYYVWGITKTGDGILELSAVNNSYRGPTVVSGGTLLVTGTLTGGGGVEVQSTAGFVYSNTTTSLADNVTVDGGTFTYNSPATYTGVLQLNGGTLAGTGSLADTTVTLVAGDAIAPGYHGTATLTTGSEIWTNGGTYLWNMTEASGAAGSAAGWDLVNIHGQLDVTAGVASPFTIDLSANALPDWNPHLAYQWTIAATSSGITGFNAADFYLDSSAFAALNSLDGGTFALQVSGNNLDMVFSPHSTPEPTPALLLSGGLAVALLTRRRIKSSKIRPVYLTPEQE